MYGNLIRNTNRRSHRDMLATYRRKWQAYCDQAPSLKEMVDPEYLICIFEDLKRRAGQAPGPDGISYHDIGKREAAQICRGLSRAVLRDRYVVSSCREVRIPKAAGQGHRTLRLRNLDYRVLSAALNTALTPMWEKLFLPQSMGFRPNRSTWTLLIDMERNMIAQNAWVIAQDDVRKAFDFVNINQVLDLHQKYIQDPQLLNFIETLLRGDNHERTIGIDQGSAYSPTCLNLALHHAHDLGMNRNRDSIPLWYRYADNLIYVCQSVSEGHQTLKKARELVEQFGLSLKGEDGEPKDLRAGDRTQLLGFTLSLKDRRLHYGLNENSFTALKQGLIQAHGKDHPSETANTVIAGWINSQGPIFENRRTSQEVLFQLRKTCAHLGFRELPARQELLHQMKQAQERLQKQRRDALDHSMGNTTSHLLLTAPPVNVFAGTSDMSSADTDREQRPVIVSPQGDSTLSGNPAGDSMVALAPVRGEPTASPLFSRRAVTRVDSVGQSVTPSQRSRISSGRPLWSKFPRAQVGWAHRWTAPGFSRRNREPTTRVCSPHRFASTSRSPPWKRRQAALVPHGSRGPPHRFCGFSARWNRSGLAKVFLHRAGRSTSEGQKDGYPFHRGRLSRHARHEGLTGGDAAGQFSCGLSLGPPLSVTGSGWADRSLKGCMPSGLTLWSSPTGCVPHPK